MFLQGFYRKVGRRRKSAIATKISEKEAGRVSQREWLGILASFEVAGIGVSVLLLAFLDPEPITKLSLLVGGGLVMTFCGGFSALYVITGLRPPTVRYNSKGGFDLSWNAEPASDPAS
jgi:hypothetical protein